MSQVVSRSPGYAEIQASGKLPSPTGVALAIMRMTQRDDVTLDALAKVIQTDPALLGRILKLANSQAVGAPRPITTVVEALKVLGFSVVRQLALGLSIVSNHFSGNCEAFDYKGFWSRSLATGCALQILSRHDRILTPEDGFTCGVLSGIGYLGLASVFPEVYSDLQRLAARDPETDLAELERVGFGIDHNELTGELLSEWKLPKLMIDAVLHHERLDDDPKFTNSRGIALARQLNLAAFWATLCVSPEKVRGDMLGQFFEMGRAHGLDRETLIELDGKLVTEWRAWGETLRVPVHSPVPLQRLEGIASPANKAGATDSPLGILIADRDEAVRTRLSAVLATAGRVETASDADELFAMMVTQPTDIVVADWHLSDGDSLAFLKGLRETPQGNDKYVILLGSDEDEDGLIRALDVGADDYVTKPIRWGVLESRVRIARRVVALKDQVTSEMREVQRYLEEVAAANERWEEAASTDILTGLPNRRYALERLEQEWSNAVRNDRPLSCMLIDIDFFKRVNDTHGHAVGDTVLRSVANVLRVALRTEDLVCRMGGEEFLVICGETSKADAAAGAGERLRKAVANHAITDGAGFGGRVTISVGVAERDAKNTTVDALLKSADAAVYRAKQDGRNRVSVVS